MTVPTALETMVRLGRLLASSADSQALLQTLAEAATDLLAVDGAAVFAVTEEGSAQCVASRGLTGVAGLCTQAEHMGPELLARIREAIHRPAAAAEMFPLVCDGDLFGGLVLVLPDGALALSVEDRTLAEGLADMAAASLAKVYREERLRRAYSQLRTAREAMVRSERLRALGHMAAGVAHDLRNLLHPIAIEIALLERVGPEDLALVSKVAHSLRSVLRRGLDTVERLRSFSRQSPEVKSREEVDLNLLTEETLELARAQLSGTNITLREELGDPPTVLLEPSEFVSVLLNLVVNAIEAMHGMAGTLVVRTGERDGGGIVEVVDTGRGMTPEARTHLFEPFFTTKGEEGTGLGLSMAYAFVQRHDGTIEVESKLGQGTKVTLCFPGRATVQAVSGVSVSPAGP